MFSYITKNAVARKNKVGIFVHRKELLDQVSLALNKFGVEHGFIAADMPCDLRHQAYVCSAATYARRPYVPEFDLIIADECHHFVKGSMWDKCREKSPKAKLLGVTATPARLDGRGLGEIFDHLIIGPDMRDLINRGYLCDYKVYMPTLFDTDGIAMVGGDFDKEELEIRVDKPKITGDAIDHYARLARGKRNLVFGVTIRHSKHLADAYNAAGIPAAHLDGTTPRLVRKQAMADFACGRVPILTNVGLFDEGLDVDGIEVVQCVKQTASLTRFIQMFCRALNPMEGKSHAILIDHGGNFGSLSSDGEFIPKHGLLDDERAWSLDPRKKRKKKSAPQEVRIKMCPQCYRALEVTVLVCPDCTHVFVPKVRDIKTAEGELAEVDPLTVKRMKRMKVAQARTREELEAVALENGYKAGWVDHILTARNAPRVRM
jgi:superfamily II DNA or RNA helicase